MPLLVAFLPLITLGIGILIGYSIQGEDVAKSAEEVFGPGPGVKPDKELPKWDRRQ